MGKAKSFPIPPPEQMTYAAWKHILEYTGKTYEEHETQEIIRKTIEKKRDPLARVDVKPSNIDKKD